MVGVRIRAQKAGQTQGLRKVAEDWQNVIALLSELWAFLLHRTNALAHFPVSIWLWFLWRSKLKIHGNRQGGGPVGPCKGAASLPFLQLPSLCENMRYPLMPFKPGCYFVASFFQTLSVSNWKWASVNCSHSKRSIILSSRALVTLYLQRKTRLLALILPTTL